MRALINLRSTVFILLAGAGLCSALYAAGPEGSYQDTAPFVCVPTAVAECVNEDECRPGTAESENLPDLFKIDLKEKPISSKDKKRLSLIKGIDRTGNDNTLYGTIQTGFLRFRG
jgi:hypothetical protein